jgi:hypothetical protein
MAGRIAVREEIGQWVFIGASSCDIPRTLEFGPYQFFVL